MNKTSFYSLEGEKIRIIPMTVEDIEAVHSFASDPVVSRFIGWPLTQNLEETTTYVKTMIDRDSLGSHIYGNVVDKSTNKVVGTAMIFSFNHTAKHAEIGYVFHQDVWGKGFGTELVQLMSDFAFNTLELHKLHAHINAANIGSSRVLEKNGYEVEGRLKDYNYIDHQYYDSLLYAKL